MSSKTLAALTSAILFSSNIQAVMDCDTVNGELKCTSTQTFYRNGGDVDVNFSLWYNSYRADVYYISGNPYPNYMNMGELEDILESQNDKEIWNNEKKADFITSLSQVKLLINYILMNYDLDDAMSAKLGKALGQANTLLSSINNVGQISNHLINQEWGYAGSELATALAGLAITAGGSIAIVAGAPVALTTAVVMVSSMVILPKIEDWGDSQLEQFNHKRFLDVINLKFELPNIYKLAEDAADDIICSMLPPHKQFEYGCSIKPIILDLDGNGISYTKIEESSYFFDVNNDGVLDKLRWPSSGNGMLFVDWNGSGFIDKRTEFMFSLFSPRKFASDLEGLMTFDYDGNNIVNDIDPIYEKLFIWNDKNEDGIQTDDEVESLENMGVELHFKRSDVINIINSKQYKSVDQIFKYKSSAYEGNAYSVRMKVMIN
ncbi:hypothetical protein [Pseudoalteromonas gelatinilytica]